MRDCMACGKPLNSTHPRMKYHQKPKCQRVRLNLAMKTYLGKKRELKKSLQEEKI